MNDLSDDFVGYIKKVLYFKIGATVALWFVPLLFSPPAVYKLIGMPAPNPDQFARLLGIAYAALIVAYYAGIVSCDHITSLLQEYNNNGSVIQVHLIYLNYIVKMGIVSNFGAFWAMLIYGASGTWSNWSVLANIYMYTSLVILLAISVNLFWILHKLKSITKVVKKE